MKSARSLTSVQSGFARIFKSRTSETVIFKPVEDLFPDHEVVHHDQPSCISGGAVGSD